MALDPVTGAALIGVGSSIVGGIMGDKSAERAADKNAAMQKEFAQHGIRWKVKDALAAGIAPEYALGASTHSASPTHVGGSSGSMIADAGQNVARAVLAQGTKEDRAIDQAIKRETLRGMTIDNDLRSHTTPINGPTNPPFPSSRGNAIEGQGNSPVKDVPLERTGMSASAPHSEGGAIPSVGWSVTQDGGVRPVPSQDIKNRIEDQMVPEAIWALQHQVAPNFGKGAEPPKNALPPGYKYWRWSKSRQAYYPSKSPPNKSKPNMFDFVTGKPFGDAMSKARNRIKGGN